jgi:dTDP-4-dehydrorhamnose reductase
MRVLITGANGQLGFCLARMLGDRAIPVDRDVFDITNLKECRRWFSFERVDAIINCAAYTNVNAAEYRESELCNRVNVEGVANLLQCCPNIPFYQISTDYVFHGGSTTPYKPGANRNPCNIYGRSKMRAEDLVNATRSGHTIRTSGLYAVGYRNFVSNIVAQAQEGKTIKAAVDQTACLTYVPHLAKAIIHLLDSYHDRGIYHIAGEAATTWYEYAKTIVEVGGYDVPVIPVSASAFGGAPRPKYSVLDCQKYYEVCSAPEMPTWRQGILEYFMTDRGAHAT